MSRIHKRKFRGKLKYKYLAAFIGVSLFLALMLTFSYYWYFNRMYEQQTQEYIRRFRERFVDRDCSDLLKRKDLTPTPQTQALGVTDHCGILIVSAVEILCDYIAELKGE